MPVIRSVTDLASKLLCHRGDRSAVDGENLVVSIMIVGEVDLVRGALAAVLAHEVDLEVVSDLSLRDDVMSAARRYRPDVVVIDFDRYRPEGLDVARRLAGELPECRLLLLATQQTAAVLRPVLAAGVWGLVSRDSSPERLIRSVRQVARGDRVFDADLAAAALRPANGVLTEQEIAVLSLAGDGLRSREIAQRLHLAPGTVRNYLSAAKRKIGARTLLEAFRRAQEEGWL